LAFRRSAHSAWSPSTSSDSLLVTHPFHPLTGERLPILYERRCASGRVYVCEGGALGTVSVPAAWSDRHPRAPAPGPLTAEVLAALARLLAAIEDR
jgi:hypothetical protein